MNAGICQNNTQTYLTQNLILKSFNSTACNFKKKPLMNQFHHQRTSNTPNYDVVNDLQSNQNDSISSKAEQHSGAKSYKSQQTAYSTPTSIRDHQKSPIELDFDSNSSKLQKLPTQKSQSQIQNLVNLQQYQNQSKQKIQRKNSEVVKVTLQIKKDCQYTKMQEQKVNTLYIQANLTEKIRISKNLKDKSNYFFMRPNLYKCAKTICEKLRMSRQVYFMAMQLIDQYYQELLCPYEYNEFVNIFYACTIIASKVASKKILSTPFVAKTIKRKQSELIQFQFKLIKFFKYKVYRQTFVTRLGNYLQEWNSKCPQLHLFKENIKAFSIYYKIFKLLEQFSSSFQLVCDKILKQTLRKVFNQEFENQNQLQKLLAEIFQGQQNSIQEQIEQLLGSQIERRIQFVRSYSFPQTQKIIQAFELRRNTQKYGTYTIFLNSLY